MGSKSWRANAANRERDRGWRCGSSIGSACSKDRESNRDGLLLWAGRHMNLECCLPSTARREAPPPSLPGILRGRIALSIVKPQQRYVSVI